MQVVPRATDLWPDPQDQITRDQCRQWLEDPVTTLLLARLLRKAYPFDSKSNDDDSKLLQKARLAQGVQIVLEEIQRLINNPGIKEE